MSIAIPQIGPATAANTAAAEKAYTVARELEAAFLTHMLTLAGVGDTPTAFGGGSGESQFSSFLVQEYATAMAKSGGIGLAEHIFNAMITAEDGHEHAR